MIYRNHSFQTQSILLLKRASGPLYPEKYPFYLSPPGQSRLLGITLLLRLRVLTASAKELRRAIKAMVSTVGTSQPAKAYSKHANRGQVNTTLAPNEPFPAFNRALISRNPQHSNSTPLFTSSILSQNPSPHPTKKLHILPAAPHPYGPSPAVQNYKKRSYLSNRESNPGLLRAVPKNDKQKY